MKGKEIKYGILCFGFFVIGGIIVAAFYNFPKKKSDDIEIGEMETDRIKIMCESDKLILTQYLKNLLGLDLEDYAEAAEGEVTIKKNDENRSMIKIEVLKEYEDTVLEILRDKFWEVKDEQYGSEFRQYIPSLLIEEMETKERKYTFDHDIEGKYVKTKTIYIYVAYDDERMYLYFWE